MKFNRKKFWEQFKERIDETVSQEQVEGLEFLLGQMEADPFWKHIPQIAYALATIYHETAGSFQPVEEGYYLGPKTRVKAFQKKLRYYPWFGRGYVQLTWKRNYEVAKAALDVDFIKDPNLVMEPINSYKILTYGMHQGWFTGKKLDDFIKGTKKDYTNARTIINGHDKAGLIAGYARAFEKILTDSAATPAAKQITELNTETDETAKNPPGQVAADLPLPDNAVPVQIVATPPVPTEVPPAQEDTLTKIGNRFAALWTGAGAAIVAAGSFLTSTPQGIAIAIIGSVALVGVGYMVVNAFRAASKEKRDAQERKEREERDLNAKLARELREHEVQMELIKSAASKEHNTVVLTPPAIELPNTDAPAEETNL